MSQFIASAPTYTDISDYIEPARLSVELWDLKKLELKYSYDSFNIPNSNTFVTSARINPPGLSNFGSFELNIEEDADSPQLDFDVTRRANLVIMKAKKYTDDDWINLIWGIMKKCSPQRHDQSILQYKINGVGTGAELNNRIVKFNKLSKVAPTSPDPFQNDINMQTNNLFKDLLSNPTSYVVDDETIASSINLSDNDLSVLDSSPVKTQVLSINQQYVQASSVLATLLESIGADGGIDAYNKPYLKWPDTQLSGIILKSWDDRDIGKDLADRTSYFTQPWNWVISWDQQDGFINRYISQATMTTQVGGNTSQTSLGFNTNGSISLFGQDIGMQFDPQTTRLQNIAIVIQKVGNGTADPENVRTLHGHIIEDSNNAPIGDVVAYWDINLADIPTDKPAAMFLTNIVFFKSLNSENKYWITAYNRGNGPDNTIGWFTVAMPEGQKATIVTRVISKGSAWSSDHNLTSGWEISESDNALAFSIFDNFTHDLIAEDTRSQELFGISEVMIQTPFQNNPKSAQRYMDALVQLSAMPKLTTNAGDVTIPGRLFMPGVLINILDPISNLQPINIFMAEIADLTYEFGEISGGGGSEDLGSNPLGAQIISVTPIGSYNYLLESLLS